MDRLYTPWRLAYVTQASHTTPPCIFCAAINNLEHDPLVVLRRRVRLSRPHKWLLCGRVLAMRY